MLENYFKIQLSVKPAKDGLAELVPPEILQDLNYIFVIVKDGGEEGIIMVEEPESVLKKIEKDKDCTRLTAKQMEILKKSYPAPKIKKKYRILPQVETTCTFRSTYLPKIKQKSRLPLQTPEMGRKSGKPYEFDDKGNRIIDTFQTVRSGFYLIDVQVLA